MDFFWQNMIFEVAGKVHDVVVGERAGDNNSHDRAPYPDLVTHVTINRAYRWRYGMVSKIVLSAASSAARNREVRLKCSPFEAILNSSNPRYVHVVKLRPNASIWSICS